MTDKLTKLKEKLAALDSNPQANPREKVDLLIKIAYELRENDWMQTRNIVRQAHQLAQDARYEQGITESLILLSGLNAKMTNYNYALSQATKALARLEKNNNERLRAEIFFILGSIHDALGNYSDALTYELESLNLFQHIGSQKGQTKALNQIGVLYNRTGNYHQELETYHQVLLLCRETKDKLGEAIVFNNIAMAYLSLEDYPAALADGRKALQMAQEAKMKHFEANVWCTLGEINLAMGNYRQALIHFQQGLSQARQLDYRYMEAFALLKTGKVYLQQQQYSSAISNLHQALSVTKEIGARSEQYQCHHALSEAYKTQGNFEEALYHFEQFQRIKEELFNQESDSKFKNLQILHQTEKTQQEVEIHRQRNIELQKEITKRRETEDKLRQREKELRRAHTIAHLGSFHYVMGADEVVLSEELCDIAGLDNKTRNVPTTQVLKLIHPNDFEALSDFVEHVTNGGVRSTPTFRFFHISGTTRYAQLQLEAIHSPDDDLVELFGVVQDITQNVWIQKSLQESEIKFRNFIEQAFDGIVLVNETGRIIEWNYSAARITGLAKEAVLGKSLWEVQAILLPKKLDSTTAKLRQKGIEAALKTGQAPWLDQVVEAKYHHIDGAERIVQQRMFAIKTDKGFQLGSILTDVTESKAAEEEIARQNKFLHSVIEAIDSPFYVINAADYTIETANSAARALGITEGKATTCYALTRQRSTPCDGKEYTCPLKHILKTKAAIVVEHIHYDASGKPINVEVHSSPVFNDNGEVAQIVEYSIDITERKRNEEALRKLSRAVEQSPSTIVITGLSGAIEYVNPAFTKNTGYTYREAIGQNPRILKSGKHPPEFYKRMWDTLKQGQAWRGELVNKKKNGDLYWEEAIISPITNREGVITHYLAIKENITQRKQTEALLEEKEARYHAIFENSPISLWEEDYSEVKRYLDRLKSRGIRDLETYFDEHPEEVQQCAQKVKVIDVNRISLEMFSVGSKEELLATNLGRILSSEAIASFKQQMLFLSAGHTTFTQETLNHTRDNRTLHVLLKLSIAPGYEDTWEKVLVSIMDTTERTKAEIALKEAKEAAEAANRAKSVFLSTMNHELRTPLNAILGFTQLMAANPNTPPANQKHLDAVLRSGQHLLYLINDVLDMSKIEAGQVKINSKAFNLTYLLNDVENMFGAQSAQKGLRLYVDTPETLPQRIVADELKLRQILINLLGNALKFTEKGGVSLRVKVIEGDKETRRQGDFNILPLSPSPCPCLLIEVQDTGPGIALEEQKSIFDAFTQTQLGQEKGGGTGLGLPISRKYAQLMGGDLIAVSPPPTPFPVEGVEGGAGSLFQLYIPLEKSSPLDEKAAKEDSLKKPKTVTEADITTRTEIDVTRLPQPWLSEFHFAASTGDTALCLELITQIEANHSVLAAALADLVNGFQFDTLIALIEQKD